MTKLKGCIPILVTPFDQEFGIDEASLRDEVAYLVAAGVHGLATPAIASEGYKLSDAERNRVTQVVLETVAGRVPVVVSVDGNGTDVAVARARVAAQSGASTLMVLPPMFVKPDAENLRRYYGRIAAAVEIDIMVQDAPQLTGVAIPAPLLARLNQECPNITSVKIEGTPAGPKTSEVIQLSEGRMAVFAGWGGLSFWEGLARGASGCMPAPNFGPALARVYDLFQVGKTGDAYRLFSAITPYVAWSMQSIDLSVWCAKEEFVRRGLLRTATMREPVTLPDPIMRQQFDAFCQDGSHDHV